MKNRKEKTERIIGTMIIFCSIAISSFFIYKNFFGQPTSSTKNQESKKTLNLTQDSKKRINLTSGDESAKSKTLVLVLQTGCRFCTESAPFYKRLSEEVKSKNTKLIAIFPWENNSGKTYLEKLGLSVFEIKQASSINFEVTGTPTLIIFDDKGELLSSWVGKLPPEKETEVINNL